MKKQDRKALMSIYAGPAKKPGEKRLSKISPDALSLSLQKKTTKKPVRKAVSHGKALVKLQVPTTGSYTSTITPKARVVEIGIWDLGARMGFLPNVLSEMNKAQDKMLFKLVCTSIPSGLISKPQRLLEWAADFEINLSRRDREDLEDNIIAEDYFARAGVVRKSLKHDIICGIVPSMIAGEKEEEIYWNHFSAVSDSGKELLVSSFEIRRYAEEANRPFEAAIAGMILAQAMVALNSKLVYHKEPRNCLFDYNGDRSTIVECFKACKVDPECLSLADPKFRKPLVSLLETLSKYRRKIQK